MICEKLSVSKKQWVLSSVDDRIVNTLIQRYNVSELVARILAAKNLALEEVQHFIKPTLQHFIPNPMMLLDMKVAVDGIINALRHKKKITVYADYDVDGATGSAILRRYFKKIGHPCDVYIPDRIEEGYGANTAALLALKEKGTDLIVMVDCGTTAFEPLLAAKKAGLDVIVLDHHTAETKLPEVLALVNPNRIDQPELPRKEMSLLCAAGVVFLFIVALNRQLMNQGYFQEKGFDKPDVREFLDLVALGTVCDVMPLIGLNRALTSIGLKVLSKRLNEGLAQLSDVAGLCEKPSVYHLGFLLGPRINAGGRVGQSTLGSHLLSSDDPLFTKEIALQLNAYNQERQEIEKTVLQHALDTIKQNNLEKLPLLLVGGEGWHPGVIGIVASRLKEKYAKPACVVGFDGMEGKGSGRSIAGIHLGELMIQATHLGFLTKGGGHAMAAGFSITRAQFDPFYAFLIEELSKKRVENVFESPIAAALSLTGITMQLLDELAVLEPFGVGNPQPRFLIKDIRFQYCEPIGQEGLHKRCRIIDSYKKTAKLMAFRVQGTPLEEAINKARYQNCDIVVTLKKETYNGLHSASIILEDILFMDDF